MRLRKRDYNSWEVVELQLSLNMRTLIQYILIYIFVIMHGAVIWSAVIGDGYAPLFAVVVFALGVAMIFKVGMRKEIIPYALVMFICYFMSAFVNGIGLTSGLNIKTALIVCINVLMASVIYDIDPEQAIDRYVRVVLIFASVSLVFYFITLFVGTSILPSSLFPYLNWGRGHYGYLIYSYTKDSRNYGIFYEPGVYQVVLNSSLYFLLYCRKKISFSDRAATFAIIILTIVIITTGSTTGYISMIILYAGRLLERNKEGSWKILALVAILLGFLVYDSSVNGDASLVNQYLIGKINEMQLGSGTYNADTSGGARMFIIEQAMNALKKDPLFGLGANTLSDEIASRFWNGFGTGNALFSTIATKGLVTLFVTIYPIFKKAYWNRQSAVQFVIFILLYFNVSIAQSQIMYGSFVLMAMVPLAMEESALIDFDNIWGGVTPCSIIPCFFSLNFKNTSTSYRSVLIGGACA